MNPALLSALELASNAPDFDLAEARIYWKRALTVDDFECCQAALAAVARFDPPAGRPAGHHAEACASAVALMRPNAFRALLGEWRSLQGFDPAAAAPSLELALSLAVVRGDPDCAGALGSLAAEFGLSGDALDERFALALAAVSDHLASAAPPDEALESLAQSSRLAAAQGKEAYILQGLSTPPPKPAPSI